MKSNQRLFTWAIRAIGIFTLFIGSNSPVLAADVVPVLDVSIAPTSAFAQGDELKTYSITVTNTGSIQTDGSNIVVTVTVPVGLTAQTFSSTDTEWDCLGNITSSSPLTCTSIGLVLGEVGSGTESSVITLTVDVAVDAALNGTIVTWDTNTNTYIKSIDIVATVIGGGDIDVNEFTNPTPITQKPDLVILGYELRNLSNEVITTPQPNQEFIIRMTVQNRGGAPTGIFYPGVFLDGQPNYGPDHDEPPSLNLGDITSFSDYQRSPSGSLGFSKGCLYYDPPGGVTINPLTETIKPERGNYTKLDFNESLAGGAPPTTVDVHIAYPSSDYTDPIYTNTPNIRTGLNAGTYQVHLYVDPSCSAGQDESYEDNNMYPLSGAITLNVGTAPSSTLNVMSNGLYDGWMRESTETSNKSNLMNRTSSFLYVGDDAGNRQYRSILSFDTSAIPDNAVITSVTLKFKYAGVVGTLPFNTHFSLLVDIKKGAFGNYIALNKVTDFNGAPSKVKGMTFGRTLVSGWYSRALAPANFQYINLQDVTQFRLRFSKDDNHDFGADYLKLYSGNAAAADRPILIIEYTVP